MMQTTINPDYWWEQAAACDEVAMILSKGGRESIPARKELFNQCHGALERALKAILAQQSKLNDECSREHSLKFLMVTAGVYDKLNLLQKDFIGWFSSMHGKATYPDEDWILEKWSSDIEMSIMVKRYKELRTLLASYRKKGVGGGGTSGCN